jgi:hypothetical protein
MTNLVFQTFCLIGLCFILKYGAILNLPRNFLMRFKFFELLFDCCLCLGFWCGVFFGFFWGGSWFWCFYGSSVCLFADLLMKKIRKEVFDS